MCVCPDNNFRYLPGWFILTLSRSFSEAKVKGQSLVLREENVAEVVAPYGFRAIIRPDSFVDSGAI